MDLLIFNTPLPILKSGIFPCKYKLYEIDSGLIREHLYYTAMGQIEDMFNDFFIDEKGFRSYQRYLSFSWIDSDDILNIDDFSDIMFTLLDIIHNALDREYKQNYRIILHSPSAVLLIRKDIVDRLIYLDRI